MELVAWIIGGLVVFAIAAVAVGGVTASLARSPQRQVFDTFQSLEFVAEALPFELSAQLSYDEVSRILRLFHDYLHAHGVATTAGGIEDTADDVAVIDLERAADYVVERAAYADVVVEREHAVAVIDAQMAYFEAIGALGKAVDGPIAPELNGHDQPHS